MCFISLIMILDYLREFAHLAITHSVLTSAAITLGVRRPAARQVVFVWRGCAGR